MKLKLPDGVTLDTNDPEYKLAMLKDGWYIIGRGALIRVQEPLEGESLIHLLKKHEEFYAEITLDPSNRPKN